MGNHIPDTHFIDLPELSKEELIRYSRHVMISQVGEEGQRKLKNAQVLLVGAGGLGSVEALYMAAAGIGRIGIVDYDRVDTSNLQRQIIHDSPSVGMKKVESARKRMNQINPLVQVDIYAEAFEAQNARQISAPYDIILDGTDNLVARYLINDICYFSQKPYVYGAVFEFEGHVSVFDTSTGPCYRCIFPQSFANEEKTSENKVGVFGVLPGTIGTLQVTEVLKLILGIGSPLTGNLLIYDALNLNFQKVHISKNPKCRLCSEKADIHSLEDA